MVLTQEQVAEMVGQIRAERTAGRPEVAAQIRRALDNGQVYGEIIVDEEYDTSIPKPPPTHGKGSKTAAWVEFALTYSDLDEEIIRTSTKSDLIQMLKAYGVIE